ncbi:MAG: DUF6970 domain-containing protein [Flavobacteriales bacterium]
MKFITLFLLAFLGFNFSSCSDCEVDVLSDAPSCIIDLIKDDCKTEYLGKVLSYTYHGNTVYLVVPPNKVNDGGAKLYSEHCELICVMQGSTGQWESPCEDLSDTAVLTNEVLVWER